MWRERYFCATDKKMEYYRGRRKGWEEGEKERKEVREGLRTEGTKGGKQRHLKGMERKKRIKNGIREEEGKGR